MGRGQVCVCERAHAGKSYIDKGFARIARKIGGGIQCTNRQPKLYVFISSGFEADVDIEMGMML